MHTKKCKCGGVVPFVSSGWTKFFDRNGNVRLVFHLDDLHKMSYKEMIKLKRKLDTASLQITWVARHMRGF